MMFTFFDLARRYEHMECYRSGRFLEICGWWDPTKDALSPAHRRLPCCSVFTDSGRSLVLSCLDFKGFSVSVFLNVVLNPATPSLFKLLNPILSWHSLDDDHISGYHDDQGPMTWTVALWVWSYEDVFAGFGV